MKTESKEEMVFHKVADEMLHNLQDAVEEWGEDNAGDDFDLSHEMGVVTISLGSGKGTYVINKQAPNRQIWVSSPVSGPLRYDYDPARKAWFYHRDGHLLHERLREELLGMFGGDLDLEGLTVNRGGGGRRGIFGGGEADARGGIVRRSSACAW